MEYLKNKILINFIYQFGIIILTRIIGMINSVYAIKNLGSYNIGYSNLVQTSANQTSVVYDAGLNTVAIRNMVESNGSDVLIIQKIISFRIFASLVCSILWISFIIYLNPLNKYLWLLSTFFIFINALDLGFLYRSINKYNLYITLTSINPIILFVLYFIFLDENRILGIDIILLIFSSILSVFFTWVYILKKTNFILIKFFKLNEYFKLIKETKSLWLNSTIGIIYPSIQVYLIALLLGFEQNGIFKASLIFLAPFDLIVSTLSGLLLPHITKWKSYGVVNFKKNVYKLSLFLFLVFTPILLIILITPESFFHYLLGKNYKFSLITFKIILIGKIYLMIFSGFTYSVVANRNDKYFLKSSSITSIFNVGLNIILINRFGLIGAATSTLFCDLLLPTLLFFKFFNIKELNIHIKNL